MLKKLRVKFICINMGIVLAMLAVIFGLVIGSTRRNLERESVSTMQAALAGRGRRLPFVSQTWTEPGQTREIDPEELPDASLPYIRIDLDAKGRISGFEGYVTYSDSLSELTGLAETAMAREADSGVLTDWGLRYARAATNAGTRLVFVDMSGERATMRDLIQTCLIIGAASLVIFFVISLLLARWAVKPVEEAWQREKQFVSDASHELKTPLTVIMTNAELLQSPDYDGAAKTRFGDNILTMSRQMRGLVESLLDLARVDSGAERAAEALDFTRLCAGAVLPFEPLCFERGLEVRTDIAEGIRVKGSESRLRQVVDILLDNAQKYAAPGGEIVVTLAPGSRNRCTLSVADKGEPIADEDLPHLFDRFYRAEKSRSRDGSYGLGLSIAQKIVEDTGGKIWAESAEGINTFSVSLPML